VISNFEIIAIDCRNYSITKYSSAVKGEREEDHPSKEEFKESLMETKLLMLVITRIIILRSLSYQSN